VLSVLPLSVVDKKLEVDIYALGIGLPGPNGVRASGTSFDKSFSSGEIVLGANGTVVFTNPL
jgi:hypothetical protein